MDRTPAVDSAEPEPIPPYEMGRTRGSDQPVEEIHLFLNPAYDLPAPGGFLHVNWERSARLP